MFGVAVPIPLLDGTGEARRAVDVVREADSDAGDLVPEILEEYAPGTGRGFEG